MQKVRAHVSRKIQPSYSFLSYSLEKLHLLQFRVALLQHSDPIQTHDSDF